MRYPAEHKRHDLCDAVDEDQIEEEFDEGDLLVVGRGDGVRVSRHVSAKRSLYARGETPTCIANIPL